MKTIDIGLLFIAAVVLVVVLTTDFHPLWLALCVLAGRVCVALWAVAKRRREAAG